MSSISKNAKVTNSEITCWKLITNRLATVKTKKEDIHFFSGLHSMDTGIKLFVDKTRIKEGIYIMLSRERRICISHEVSTNLTNFQTCYPAVIHAYKEAPFFPFCMKLELQTLEYEYFPHLEDETQIGAKLLFVKNVYFVDKSGRNKKKQTYLAFLKIFVKDDDDTFIKDVWSSGNHKRALPEAIQEFIQQDKKYISAHVKIVNLKRKTLEYEKIIGGA